MIKTFLYSGLCLLLLFIGCKKTKSLTDKKPVINIGIVNNDNVIKSGQRILLSGSITDDYKIEKCTFELSYLHELKGVGKEFKPESIEMVVNKKEKFFRDVPIFEAVPYGVKRGYYVLNVTVSDNNKQKSYKELEVEIK